jgi:hypothetical protein
MTSQGVVSKEKEIVDIHRKSQGLPYSPGYQADYEGLDLSKVPSGAFKFMPGASTVGINEQGGVGDKPYGPQQPAKKAGGRKAAAPKATPGPKSVAAKKTPAKKQAGTKAEPKKKGTK